jgi:hypothetical protein
MGMFDGCVQVPGYENCANCHIGGHHKRCSLGSAVKTTMKVQYGVVSEGARSNTGQLLEKARKEQFDLNHLVDQTQRVLNHTQAMLDQKTQEVDALECALRGAQST